MADKIGNKKDEADSVDTFRVGLRLGDHDEEFFSEAWKELWGGKDWSDFWREMARRGVEASRGMATAGFAGERPMSYGDIDKRIDEKMAELKKEILSGIAKKYSPKRD